MSNPEMHYVSSSNVESVGHDDARDELWMTFLDGSTYVYEGVPRETFDELLSAPSVGSYLNREIKPNFRFRKL